MTRPDFAVTDVHALRNRDLRFLIENFPEPGRSYTEIAELFDRIPTTVESMLDSEFVLRSILDSRELLLDVSPFLFFNVLLRRVLGSGRAPLDRRVIHYLANLLSLFVRADRLHRIAPHERERYSYLVDMIAAAADADARRRFLLYSHIGNYSLYLTGLFPQWIEHRHRYRRRPVDMDYYVEFGRAYFERASGHPLAREYRLDEVFLRLALLFDHYQRALNELSRRYLQQAA